VPRSTSLMGEMWNTNRWIDSTSQIYCVIPFTRRILFNLRSVSLIVSQLFQTRLLLFWYLFHGTYIFQELPLFNGTSGVAPPCSLENCRRWHSLGGAPASLFWILRLIMSQRDSTVSRLVPECIYKPLTTLLPIFHADALPSYIGRASHLF